MNTEDYGKALFARVLGERTAALEAALKMIAEGGASRAEGEKIARKIGHAFKGSGALYGHPELTAAGAAAENADSESLPNLAGNLLALMKKIAGPDPLKGARIVLVEPDEALRIAASGALESAGFSVFSASTAGEAMKGIRERDARCVITNFFLPDMDTRLFIQDIADGPLTSAVPVIVLMAANSATLKNECWQLGVRECFEAPFDWAAVAARIGEVLLKVKKVSAAPPGSTASPVSPASPAATAHPAPPAAPPVPSASSAPSSPASASGPTTASFRPNLRQRILVVDDDELIGSIVEHRLNKEGYDVASCTGAARAMEMIEKENFDLMILDVQMPEIDGFSLLARVRAIPRCRLVPVILLTALGNEQDIVRGFDLGANDYIVKPFSPIELAARVRRALKR